MGKLNVKKDNSYCNVTVSKQSFDVRKELRYKCSILKNFTLNSKWILLSKLITKYISKLNFLLHKISKQVDIKWSE